MTLKQVIEALVFASPKPLTSGELRSALREAGERADEEGAERDLARCSEDEIALALAELRREYEEAGRGILLVEQVHGWALLTNPGASAWVRRLYPEAKPTRLSGPALETLAIIAYRQPVTRAEVEAVRGVAVDGVTQVLLDRELVKITGRAEVPGRPLLYGTTEFFLQHFGLKNLEQLPNAAELKRFPLPAPKTEVVPPAEALAEPEATSAAEAVVAGLSEAGPGSLTPATEEPAAPVSEPEPASPASSPGEPGPAAE